MNNKIRAYILISLSITAFVAMVFVGPLTQDPNYHFFADERLLYDMPNFWNVVTNLPFCITGILGVLAAGRVPIAIGIYPDPHTGRGANGSGSKSGPTSCYVFFIGILFTGIGSAYLPAGRQAIIGTPITALWCGTAFP